MTMIPSHTFNWEVSHEDFIKNESGTINHNLFLKIQQSTGLKCAIKKTHGILSDPDFKEIFSKEISLFELEHQAIVPFIGFYIKDDFGYIVMDYIENGDLGSLLNKHRKGICDPLLDDTHKLIIAYGISHALKFLHENQIVFRNLCLSHVLLDSELHPYLTSFDRSLRADVPAPTFFEKAPHYSLNDRR